MKAEGGNVEIGGDLSVNGLFGSSNIFQRLVKSASNPIYSYTVPVKGIYMISASVNSIYMISASVNIRN
jgi:hypothetical protein